MIYRQTPLYKFLTYCNKSNLPKKVVDCGAGGDMPPLGLFYSEGYETKGFEIDKNQLALSKEFEKNNNMNLNISYGDIRKLPFKDGRIPFIYSYGSIFHMAKDDIKKTIEEFERVLKKDGLCFINLLSKEDERCGQGIKVSEDEYIQNENGNEILHSYFDINEGDSYFKNTKIIYKEMRTFTRIYEGKKIKQSYIDYIVQK